MSIYQLVLAGDLLLEICSTSRLPEASRPADLYLSYCWTIRKQYRFWTLLTAPVTSYIYNLHRRL
jgi:hypothetical protein